MFWKNFASLCKQRGMSPSAVCHDLGLSATMVTKWKAGSHPRYTTATSIAEYFGITVEELLNGKKEKQDYGQALTVMDRHRVYMIPMYETVSAGFGALAVDHVVDYVPLAIQSVAEAKETICIKVSGDSMFPKIEDGDIVQVLKQETVPNGAIAVVLLDGDEGLVKRVAFGDSWIELQSINPMYKPIRFNGSAASRVRVVGLVKRIIKEC